MSFSKTAIALALTVTAGSAMAVLPGSVWFDGYCDGISSIAKSGTTYSGVYDQGTYCGGPNVQAGGPAGRNMMGAKILKSGGVFMPDLYPIFGLQVLWVINEDGTWAIVGTDGSVWNSGTWTAGVRRDGGGSPSISARK